jgi:hypothetical protein
MEKYSVSARESALMTGVSRRVEMRRSEQLSSSLLSFKYPWVRYSYSHHATLPAPGLCVVIVLLNHHLLSCHFTYSTFSSFTRTSSSALVRSISRT